MQRLPQYRLLFESYLQHLSESSIDYHDTVNTLRIVTEVAEHANKTMAQQENFQKLLRLQSRIKNAVIFKPGRYIIKEGELFKVNRKFTLIQPSYFILVRILL